MLLQFLLVRSSFLAELFFGLKTLDLHLLDFLKLLCLSLALGL